MPCTSSRLHLLPGQQRPSRADRTSGRSTISSHTCTQTTIIAAVVADAGVFEDLLRTIFADSLFFTVVHTKFCKGSIPKSHRVSEERHQDLDVSIIVVT